MHHAHSPSNTTPQVDTTLRSGATTLWPPFELVGQDSSSGDFSPATCNSGSRSASLRNGCEWRDGTSPVLEYDFLRSAFIWNGRGQKGLSSASLKNARGMLRVSEVAMIDNGAAGTWRLADQTASTESSHGGGKRTKELGSYYFRLTEQDSFDRVFTRSRRLV